MIKEFTIDRRKWYRGKGYYESKLVKANGHKCCLGFYGKALGAKGMLNQKAPSLLDDAEKSKFFGLISGEGTNNKRCLKLMLANDNRHISNTARERIITKEFKQIGVKVKFIN